MYQVGKHLLMLLLKNTHNMMNWVWPLVASLFSEQKFSDIMCHKYRCWVSYFLSEQKCEFKIKQRKGIYNRNTLHYPGFLVQDWFTVDWLVNKSTGFIDKFKCCHPVIHPTGNFGKHSAAKMLIYNIVTMHYWRILPKTETKCRYLIQASR